MKSVSKKHTVKATIELPHALLSGVLETAHEGGINYWALVSDWQMADNPEAQDDLDRRLLLSFKVRDIEDPAHSEVHEIDHEKLAFAIQQVLDSNAMLRKDIRESIVRSVMAGDAGDIDAEAADCLVQIALFGSIVYG